MQAQKQKVKPKGKALEHSLDEFLAEQTTASQSRQRNYTIHLQQIAQVLKSITAEAKEFEKQSGYSCMKIKVNITTISQKQYAKLLTMLDAAPKQHQDGSINSSAEQAILA